MKISCMMCVYNTKENDLREAIDSILNQTFQDFELIIVDDGSTLPHIKTTVQSYNDKRIKYFYKENQGRVGFARNFALSKCKGEYVAIMDSDDIALPDRFEKEVQFLDTHLDFFCVGGQLKTFPVKENWKTPEYPCILDCLKNSPVANSSAMYRREMVEKCNLGYNADYTIGEDYDFWVQALTKGLKLYNIQEVVYLYRRENQGITSLAKQKTINENIHKIQASVAYFLAGNNKDWLTKLQTITALSFTRWINVLGVPLIKIKIRPGTKKYYLFGKIKVCKIKG